MTMEDKVTSVENSSVLKHMERMNEFRKQDFGCDFTIEVDGRKFPVHKIVLAACCEYYRAMFSANMVESRAQHSSLPYKYKNIIKHIIEFAYTGKLELTEANLMDTLELANYLNASEAINRCCDFLLSRLTLDNCVDHLNSLNDMHPLDLRRKVFNFIIRNIDDVNWGDFYNLFAEDLLSMLSENALVVGRESYLVSYINKWILHDKENRQKHAAELFEKVRLALLSPDELFRIDREMRTKYKELLLPLKKAMYYHLLEEKQALMQDESTQVRSDELSIVMVTSPTFPCFNLDSYQLSSISCTRFDIERSSPAYICACEVNNFMYFSVNYTDFILSPKFYRFDPRHSRWYQLPSLLANRTNFVIKALDDKIYAIAGTTIAGPVDSVECFSIRDNEWRYCQTMPYAVNAHAGCVYNKKIYISGGFHNQQYVNLITSYDPVDNSWNPESTLKYPRAFHCMVTVADRMYVIGGQRNISPTSSGVPEVEIFKPGEEVQTICISLLVSFSTAVVKNDNIYIIGGMQGGVLNYSDILEFNTQSMSVSKHSICVDLDSIGNGFMTYNSCCLLKLPHVTYMKAIKTESESKS